MPGAAPNNVRPIAEMSEVGRYELSVPSIARTIVVQADLAFFLFRGCHGAMFSDVSTGEDCGPAGLKAKRCGLNVP